MKKSELVTLVAEKTGFSKKDTEKTIDTVFTAIADIMAAGDKLQISGFGTFETKERAARTGHIGFIVYFKICFLLSFS